MLKINNLKKHFGGVKAVAGCDFAIKENLITALIGPNGAGKSTVFNLISGLLKADGGAITFENKNIINLSPEKISNLGISRLFQQTRLFKNLTVLDCGCVLHQECFYTCDRSIQCPQCHNPINKHEFQNCPCVYEAKYFLGPISRLIEDTDGLKTRVLKNNQIRKNSAGK